MYKLILLFVSATCVSAGLYSGYENDDYVRYGGGVWVPPYTPAYLHPSSPIATSYSNLYKVSLTPSSRKIVAGAPTVTNLAYSGAPYTLPVLPSAAASYPDLFGYGYGYRQLGYVHPLGHGLPPYVH